MSATLAAAHLTTEYRLALRAHAQRVAHLIASAWRGVSAVGIDESMSRVLPVAASAITAGQRDAVTLSYAYVNAFLSAELGRHVNVAPATLNRVVGYTITGKTVPYAVGFQPVYAKALIAAGRTATDALNASLANLQATGRSELFRAAQTSTRAQSQASGHIDRYQRVTGGHACPFCQMLAGRGAVYRLDTSEFRSHRNCTCTAEPVVRGVDYRRYQHAS